MLTSLLDKYVRKSPVLSYSPLVKEGSKKVDWKNKPSDWSDIRKDCPKNSIALYAAHPSNFSQYDNLGFTATCTGGYNVFIDGVQYHAKNLITNDIDGQGTYISPSYTTTTRIHKSLANIPLGTYTLTITGNFYFIMQKKIENVGENIGSWETSATYTFDDATATYGIAIRKADNSNITPSEFDGTLQLENGSTATAYEPYGLFASGTQCNITWSTSGITTGDDITTPSAMKAHKIWIEPATEGNDITKFCCQRVAASGYEEQGVLWAHFNLTNTINLNTGLADDYSHHNNLMKACTAKNNVIKISGLNSCFHNMQKLEYVPTFDGDNNIVDLYASFYLCLSLEKINFKNTRFRIGANTFNNAQALKKLPKLDYSSATEMQTFLETNTSLEDTVLDVRDATGLKVIQCRGWSGGFMSGFKGLRVSNEAPFDGSSPQINVSYTGMDRDAIVTLFNDLPTVSSGQIINITGCTGTADLTQDDKDIALNKGWSITIS